ncbi:MAG: exosortase/archaeosortase family protein [Deltaproteobacteria bacterium]|nr:exosortase/archaeosortase family protein [Deltaproteobacteria bacterium]
MTDTPVLNTSKAPPEQPTGANCSSQNAALIALALFAAIILFLYYPVLESIARVCWDNEDYSHGLILPLITGYLIVTKRKELSHKMFGAGDAGALDRKVPLSKSGLILLVLGVLTYLVGTVSQLFFTAWISFFLTTIGTLQLLLGTSAASPYIAPIGLMFMAKPMPDSLVPKLFWPLQVMAAKISAWLLELLEVPVYLQGNIIEIPGMRLMVEEACSGIRSMMALLTVALIVMFIVEMSTISRFVIFFVSVATAVVLNVIRVAATGVLAHFVSAESATGFFHTFSGIIVFIIGLAVVYSLAIWLERGRAKAKPAEAV